MGRRGEVYRSTAETEVKVELVLDGSGEYQISTGLPLFDHFLSQLGKHGLMDIKISAKGEDAHHLIEDVAICLGRALNEALGNREGIRRFAHALVPMDEALVLVALDLGGRGFAQIETPEVKGFHPGMVGHFLRSLAVEARMGLHTRILSLGNEHHQAEALFKALALSLRDAIKIEERLKKKIPSTKELIDQG